MLVDRCSSPYDAQHFGEHHPRLSDGFAVILGALSQVDRCGVGFHTLRHGRCSLIRFRKLRDFYSDSRCESCSAHIQICDRRLISMIARIDEAYQA